MPTLVVAIEIEVQNKTEGLRFLEHLTTVAEGYIYPVSYNGLPVDEDLDDLR